MMPSSLIPDADQAEMAARRLAPSRPIAVTARGGGGNNRLYRVDTAGGTPFALKRYPLPNDGDRRDRLGTEWAALDFLNRQGVANIPRPVAMDRESGFALQEWIEGEPIGAPGAADLAAALSFLGTLHELRAAKGADALPLASEACLSASDILAQLERRCARLSRIMKDHDELADFLTREFNPLREEIAASLSDGDSPLAPQFRTLSPSDFGFHNALRRPDGTLAFLDFEYFGWDDPVKLVADFLQHPGMTLSDPLGDAFRRGAASLYGGEAAFAERLRLRYPLFGLRWCLILLNEFLPERWQGRVFAGARADHRTITSLQLAKARDRLAQLRRHRMDQWR